jgi:phosphomannomutase
LTAHFSNATANRLDGLRLDWPDRWLLVRASNTEPIVRIIAEAPSEHAAKQLCAEAAQVVRQS